MASTKISLQEDNILKLVLEFLTSRKLYKATRALEKEANVVNCPYSDSITFLRELVLDGEWDAVEDFAQPLEDIQEFDCRKFHFLVTKQKYLEILFKKCEGIVEDKQGLRDSLVSCLNSLEKCCPLKDEYNKLYWYLSVPSLRDEPEFSDWNIDLSRMVLFEEIVALLKTFIPVSEQNSCSTEDIASEDRLLSLLSKGFLYENCIDFCQKQAMHKTNSSDFSLTNIRTDFFRAQPSNSSGNFFSWLHSLPAESFVIPFEQLSVEVEVEKPKWTRARVDMKNNSLSRSLTLESRTPNKNFQPRSSRVVEKKHSSNRQQLDHRNQFDFNSRDVSQSWANFDINGGTIEVHRIPVNGEEDGLSAEAQIDDESSSKTVQSPQKMKHSQQEAVLQRLEEHKKKQQELHRQLAEMTTNVTKEDDQDTWGEKGSGVSNYGVASRDITSSKSMEALRRSKNSFRLLNKGYESPNVGVTVAAGAAGVTSVREMGDIQESGRALVNDNHIAPSQMASSSRLKSEEHLTESNTSKSPYMPTKLTDQPKSPQAMSSTRPKRISIQHESPRETDTSKSASLSTSTTLPKTPINRLLPPGLVNLSDGSGVFNTSTPKSHRQTYMTPPPPASPVTSEPNTIRNSVLRQSHQNEMTKQEMEKKSNVDMFNQTPKSSAPGTKHSVVRRSLVNDIMEEKHRDDNAFAKRVKPGSTTGSVRPQVNHTPQEMKFHKIAALTDTQAVRSVAFHPGGKCFAVGTNSKALIVCSLRDLEKNKQSTRSDLDVSEPDIVYKKTPIHRGSVYCVAFNANGDIIATGSNDKLIKVLRFDEGNLQSSPYEMELAIHNATVRDLAFVNTAGSLPLLASGGAGGGLIHMSDCWTGQTVSSLRGHNGNIMTIFASPQANLLCSGSADKSVRLWDLRLPKCIDVLSSSSCVTSVCFNYGTDPMLLASAHENGQCVIYDVSARKPFTTFHPHTTDCRSIRFSPDSKYVLTGSYDASIAITPVRYNLDAKMLTQSQTAATHRDKVIQCRWHPSEYTFLSSSADKTAALWTLDEEEEKR